MSFFHFLCTAEATAKYCQMVRLWAWSLKNKTSLPADTQFTVTFNDCADEQTVKWLMQFEGASVNIRPRLSKQHAEVNKYNALWSPDIGKSEWVILTDCDVVFVNSIVPLINLLAEVEFGASPEGHNPVNPPPGHPENYRAIRNYEELLLSEISLSLDQLRKHRHPWFTDKCPRTDYPYFNGGFIAIKTSKLKEFRNAVVELSQKLYFQMRWNHPDPIFFLRRFWNSRWDRTRWADFFCIGPFFRQRYADQVALAAAVLKLNLKYTVLPHSYNWRCAGMGHGEEVPPRVIHYFQPAFGIPLTDILKDYWIDSFLSSKNYGKKALAETVLQFLKENRKTNG